MGRSVDYLSRAIEKTFIHFELNDVEDEMELESDWDFFTYSVNEVLKERIPSLEFLSNKESRWDGRETRIFAENTFAELGISEYCGLVSISIRINEYREPDRPQLAANWINKVWPNVEKALAERFTTLRKVATFSNGEGVYEKV